MEPVNRLFCFGLGYTALFLAGRLQAEGWSVVGTCRDVEKQGQLRERGIEAYLFDRNRPLDDPGVLSAATHVLSSVPPDSQGDLVLDHHSAAIAAMRELTWLGYLSTTGVYGDRAGGWVDEQSERRPSGARSARRVAAEDGWLALWEQAGVPVHIFRLAGIYGPGRNQLEAVRAGRARRIDKPDQVFSRVHVEDIATVLAASMARPDPGAVYNVCDDEPTSAATVTEYACELLGVEPPPLVPLDKAELTPMARSFYADNRRVCNQRIKDELGVRLAYPNYRLGLEALAATS